MKFANKIISALVFSALALTLTENSFSQTRTVRASASTTSRTVLFDLDELRPGMKGVARTVFSGSEPQEFNLEILGLLAGFSGPRQSTIIARLSGPNVARTGVFAGMSGSPVFIDNKLVGAIAYSFPFAKEPICGITPIKQMIDIFEQGSEKPKSTEARAVSFTALASADWKLTLPNWIGKVILAGASRIPGITDGIASSTEKTFSAAAAPSWEWSAGGEDRGWPARRRMPQ